MHHMPQLGVSSKGLKLTFSPGLPGGPAKPGIPLSP